MPSCARSTERFCATTRVCRSAAAGSRHGCRSATTPAAGRAGRSLPQPTAADPSDIMPLPIPATPPAILVVEDETAVRLLICRMLRGLGFECVEAVNGRDALRIIRQREQPFALVLTDL